LEVFDHNHVVSPVSVCCHYKNVHIKQIIIALEQLLSCALTVVFMNIAEPAVGHCNSNVWRDARMLAEGQS